ncbi:protein phosphatase 2C and cyclic nucleotide-binding/kinase domain-containing protein [Plutella xylostella]|uniref:protein phosphatase 2C and cyclic nucleotide-binding/kinase domain-containing protein n=1 Tax=Plutella xylostella TaxID=51655 RepID=UPI0020331024|nr:protein phosphatase 2C and cyclic nucleotide-binding/kinase domain-containing protein [Plutella xylostella]
MLTKAQKEQDAMLRAFRAKCRFRALVRQARANSYWLMECEDSYDGVDDVKRRVEQAVRAVRAVKTKKHRLTITDKVLLCKPAEERTVAEQQYLNRIIGGLKCFKRYPDEVKKKLAAVTYFKYYGPGRVIVRQHQEAHALYFIVTGDVTVSLVSWDELLKAPQSTDVGTMHPGDMFGEVSLLHNIPRTATCTTVGHCELLVLMKEDFKNVLQESVQKQWDSVKKAMSQFTYFDGLDEVARREGCIMAKMKTFQPNDVILGDGIGMTNFVYFVLSGHCEMIESLQISAVKYRDSVRYSLYDPYIPTQESDQDFEAKYFSAYKNKEAVSQETESESSTNVSSLSAPLQVTPTRLSSSHNPDSKLVRQSSKISDDADKNTIDRADPESTDDATKGVPPNLRTYFMKVCEMSAGATFGFGESMRDRRVVAAARVACMLLPKVWLLQKNTTNIWTRVQRYLERKIPTKRQLFNEFVSARRWQKYREQVVSEVTSRTNTINFTSIHDVPYYVRMAEMTDSCV